MNNYSVELGEEREIGSGKGTGWENELESDDEVGDEWNLEEEVIYCRSIQLHSCILINSRAIFTLNLHYIRAIELGVNALSIYSFSGQDHRDVRRFSS